jgi:hypothetical protein
VIAGSSGVAYANSGVRTTNLRTTVWCPATDFLGGDNVFNRVVFVDVKDGDTASFVTISACTNPEVGGSVHCGTQVRDSTAASATGNFDMAIGTADQLSAWDTFQGDFDTVHVSLGVNSTVYGFTTLPQ